MYYNREYDALINLCTKAIKRHPYSPTAYWYLALSHRQKEDYVSAKKYFLQLLELAPSWEKEFVEPYFRDGEVIPSVKSEN